MVNTSYARSDVLEPEVGSRVPQWLDGTETVRGYGDRFPPAMSVVEEGWDSRSTTPVHETRMDRDAQMSDQEASLSPAVPSFDIQAHTALAPESRTSFRSELEPAQHQHWQPHVPGAFSALNEEMYNLGSSESVSLSRNAAAALPESATPEATDAIDTGEKDTIKHDGSSENWFNGLLKWAPTRVVQALPSRSIGRTQTRTGQNPEVKSSIVHEARPMQQQAVKRVAQTTVSASNVPSRSAKTTIPMETSKASNPYEKHLTKPLRKTIVSRAALEKLHIEFKDDADQTTVLVDEYLPPTTIAKARELSLELCKL